jgi:hypothetical protein
MASAKATELCTCLIAVRLNDFLDLFLLILVNHRQDKSTPQGRHAKVEQQQKSAALTLEARIFSQILNANGPILGLSGRRKIPQAGFLRKHGIPKRLRSQGAFAASSACNRIAFAQWWSLKPDCACALQRKTPGNEPVTFDGPLSPVRFKGKTCRIAAIFNDSCSNAARFLCNPDCVAEREGFENLD